MSQINADPILLEQIATELDRIVGDIFIEGDNLKTAGDNTRAIWQSRYTSTFSISIDRTRDRVNNCAEQVRLIAIKLRSTAANIREAERRIKQLKK